MTERKWPALSAAKDQVHAHELPKDVLDAIGRHPYRPGMKRWTSPRGGKLALIATVFLLSQGCDVTARQDVRYDPSPMPVVRAMLELAQVGPDDVVYDLGSGDGRIPITAARELGARGVGVEIDPALIMQARANARAAGVEHKVEFIEGDMYETELHAATVVALFLHPDPNLKLRPKLLAQLRPGARVVSYIWDMGDWKPDAVRRVNDRNIYLWRIPKRPASLQQMPEPRDEASARASPPPLPAALTRLPSAQGTVE